MMKALRKVFGANGDLVLVVLLVAILLVLFTPIPSGLLDVLLLINFAFALQVLLITLYAQKPVDFSTFPSLLLIATLFLAQGEPLEEGPYEIMLRGDDGGTRAPLAAFDMQVGGDAAPLRLRQASWAVTDEDITRQGNEDYVTLTNRHVASTRQYTDSGAARIIADAPLTNTTVQAYSTLFMRARDDTHRYTLTSNGGSPANLTFTVELGAEEDATVAGAVQVERRAAGSLSSHGSPISLSRVSPGLWQGSLNGLAAGAYEFKLFYVDGAGREVQIARELPFATTESSLTRSGQSRIIQAREAGGSLALDSGGLVRVDPGLYIGVLDPAILQGSAALGLSSTGVAGGSSSASGLTTGNYVEYRYNALDARIASRDTDGLWRTFGVDVKGNAVETRLYGKENGTLPISTFARYDARNRKTKEWSPHVNLLNGTRERPITDTTYNVLDKVTRVSGSAVATRSYEYNAQGTLVKEVLPGNKTRQTRINVLGAVTGTLNELGYLSRKFYDARGRLVREQDATSRNVRYEYDNFGRREAIIDGRNQRTDHLYDQRDRLIQITTALDAITTFAYDGRNNRTVTTDARGNISTQQYDGSGRVVRSESTRLNAVGETETLFEAREYDVYGNLTSTRKPFSGRSGPITVESRNVYLGHGRLDYSIDEEGTTFHKGYDDYGRLVREISVGDTAGQSIVRTYDNAGRPLTVVDESTGVRTTYTYDLRGRRVRETIQGTAAVTPGGPAAFRTLRDYTYQYDDLDRLIYWIDAVSGQNLHTDYHSDGGVKRNYTDLGYNPGNISLGGKPLVDNNYTYDRAGRLLTFTQRDGSSTVYTYDAAGNRATWKEKGITYTYVHDAENRVSDVRWSKSEFVLRPGTGILVTELVAYHGVWRYDKVGNMESREEFRKRSFDTRELLQSYTYNYSVDGAGNRTGGFDEQNHVTISRAKAKAGDKEVVTQTDFNLSGRVARITTTVGGGTPTTYDHYYYKDGREESVVGHVPDGGGDSTFTYDANKVRIRVDKSKGSGMARPEWQDLLVDNDGHILRMFHDDGKNNDNETPKAPAVHEYTYALGNPVGEVARDSDGKITVNLDLGHYNLVRPLGADNPGASVTQTTTVEGDTLQSVAARVYGTPSLWFVLADANGLNGTETLKGGTVLSVPNTNRQGLIDAQTHKVYSENEIIGSSLPNIQYPGPSRCATIITIVVIVIVAAAVAALTAGAGALLVGALGAAASTAGTVAAYAVVGAAAAALGSMAQQGILIALGYQAEFSWDKVGNAAVTGAITGAASGVGSALKAGAIAAESATWAKVASAGLQVGAAATRRYQEGGRILSWSGVASYATAAIAGYANASEAAQQAAGTADTARGFFDTTVDVVNKWGSPLVQPAVTWADTRQFRMEDWVGVAAETLITATRAMAGNGMAPSSSIAGAVQEAVVASSVRGFAFGAIAMVDQDKANAYLDNAIGQTVGNLIGDPLAGFITRSFDGWTESVKQARRPKALPLSAGKPAVTSKGSLSGTDVPSDAQSNPLTPRAQQVASEDAAEPAAPGVTDDSSPALVPESTLLNNEISVPEKQSQGEASAPSRKRPAKSNPRVRVRQAPAEPETNRAEEQSADESSAQQAHKDRMEQLRRSVAKANARPKESLADKIAWHARGFQESMSELEKGLQDAAKEIAKDIWEGVADQVLHLGYTEPGAYEGMNGYETDVKEATQSAKEYQSRVERDGRLKVLWDATPMARFVESAKGYRDALERGDARAAGRHLGKGVYSIYETGSLIKDVTEIPGKVRSAGSAIIRDRPSVPSTDWVIVRNQARENVELTREIIDAAEAADLKQSEKDKTEQTSKKK